MPMYDGTGPWGGSGSRTGRQMGPCLGEATGETGLLSAMPKWIWGVILAGVALYATGFFAFPKKR